jgi:hypothetical protein
MKRSFQAVFLAGLLATALSPGFSAQAQEAGSTGGWVCGMVKLENGGFAVEPQVLLFPEGQPDGEPVVQIAGDARGQFCFEDVPQGFYELLVEHEGWPRQLTRKVEVRTGLMNRLTPSIEVQLEPGDPSVRYEESFEGMPPGEARTMLGDFLRKGDQTSLEEAARRFLPKRGVPIDLNRILGGDPKPLVHELMRQLEDTRLPPLKTARYLYIIGELGDPRIQDIVVPFLLLRLNDGRTLPREATMSEQPVYVSDIVIQEVARYSGKDFKWEYGLSPIRNQRGIRRARDWWRNELAKRNEGR